MDTVDDQAARFFETVRVEADLLADVVVAAGDGAPVPTCPGWTAADLLVHLGQTHRWALRHLRDKPAESIPYSEADDGVRRSGPELDAWFRTGAAELVATGLSAPADLRCPTFLPTDRTPLQFWARRQAHETTVHRVDGELAGGRGVTPVEPAYAADGVDELLVGFLSRRGRRAPRLDPARTIAIVADEPATCWAFRIGPEGTMTTAGPVEDADLTIAGPAPALYLSLWNRAGADDLRISGDPELLDLWRTRMKVL